MIDDNWYAHRVNSIDTYVYNPSMAIYLSIYRYICIHISISISIFTYIYIYIYI